MSCHSLLFKIVRRDVPLRIDYAGTRRCQKCGRRSDVETRDRIGGLMATSPAISCNPDVAEQNGGITYYDEHGNEFPLIQGGKPVQPELSPTENWRRLSK
jgi:hypothetical protein